MSAGLREAPAVDINQLMRVIQKLSVCILENGGETSRAEESVTLICRKFDCECDVNAFPTGAFVTVTDPEGQFHTIVGRVKRRSVNLTHLDQTNSVSRGIVRGELSLEQADQMLAAALSGSAREELLKIPLAALNTACFAMLFRGSWLDFLGALICGAGMQAVQFWFGRLDMYHCISSFMGGAVAALIASMYAFAVPGASLHLIITSSIMPLLPGLAMVNAIRDTMSGDLVSGISRLGEVLLVAVFIAAGAGLVLYANMLLGGTM